jgi:acetoin utilization deacetylase AcuC-like enzyme
MENEMPTPRNGQIHAFYRPQMVPAGDIGTQNYSKSPQKPGRMMAFLEKEGLLGHFLVDEDWPSFTREDFLLAHTADYVDDFFAGKPPRSDSNWFHWTPGLAESVRWTNASLYQAIRYAVLHPQEVTLTPVSGFHHATPHRGDGFCTFSGQVIAAVRLWREHRCRTAFIDCDQHFGNSIEDSRFFAKDLAQAIPPGANLNPEGSHQAYLLDLQAQLQDLGKRILRGEIHVVVFCHGADSHEWDDMHGQCTTAEWLKAGQIVYEWVRELDERRGQPLPLALALFGGYRRDDFDSVLALHAADLVACLNILCGHRIPYTPRVKDRSTAFL